MKKLILLISIILIASCGVRKSSVAINDKKIETHQDAEIKNNLTTQADTKVQENNDISNLSNIQEHKVIDSSCTTVTEKRIYTPIDNSKPAQFIDETGKQQTLNNATLTTEKTTNKANKNTTDDTHTAVAQTDKSIVIINAAKKSQDLGTKKTSNSNLEADHSKNKDTFNFPLYWLWFLLLIPIGYFAWKNKNKFFV